MPRLDARLAKAFAPHRLTDTVAAIAAASGIDDETTIVVAGIRKLLADCDRKLAQYRARLDEGPDAAVVANGCARSKPNASDCKPGSDQLQDNSQ